MLVDVHYPIYDTRGGIAGRCGTRDFETLGFAGSNYYKYILYPIQDDTKELLQIKLLLVFELLER